MQPFLLNTDGDPKNQPDKSSRLNINVNLDYEYGTISTEDGNNPIHLFPTEETPRATIIGKIPLRDGNIVQFSVISGNSTINGVSQRLVTGEIGVLSPNNNYRVVVRDNGPDPEAGDINVFGWNLNTQIQGIYKINSDNTISIYWVDGTNPLRTLNIDNPQVETDNYNRIVSSAEFSKLFALSDFTQPSVTLTSVDNNGNLPTGVYYTVLAYADENYNETNFSFPFGPVSIINETVHAPLSEYDGAPANSPSSKSFTIGVTAADTTFTYFRMYVIAKIDSVYTVYDYGYQAIPSSGDCAYQIDTLNNKPTSSLDALVNRVNWIPKVITQLDNKAYLFNLKEKERPNLQPWINGIVVDVSNDITTPQDAEAFNESFHNELNITSQRVFQFDEVYALYASVIFKDGSESELYHIPGRDAVNVDLQESTASTITVLENASIASAITFPNWDAWTFNGGGVNDTSPGGELYNLDTSVKIFQAFNCANNANVTDVKGTGISSNLGYWENRNETYPDNLDWVIRQSDGTVYGKDLRNNVVRHHKMPSVEDLQQDGPYEFNRLALKFSNIQLPAEYQSEITHIRFHYAKRTNENRLVFGQSILFQDNTLLDKDNNAFVDGSGLYSNNFSFSLGTTVELEDFQTGGTGVTEWKNMPLLANRFRMSPFDSMIGDIDPSASSYIKIFSYLEGTFTGSSESISNSSPILNYTVKLDFVPSAVNDVTNYSNYLRRLKGPATLAESVPAYPNGDVGYAVNAGSLNYVKNTVHYKSEKHIIIETYNDVDKAVLYPDGILTYTTSSGTQGIRNLLLANLCIYKTDLYNSFDSQETVAMTGFTQLTANAFNGTSESVATVYGGDTFVSIYGHRGVADAIAALNMATPGNTAGEWRVLHTYICESNANINYRHQGLNQYDLYYPKSTADSVLAIPLIPNGEGNYYGYNNDYTSVNDLNQPSIHSKNPVTQVTHFPTRIARSATDNPESIQDNYRIYLANEYVDVEKSKGAIVNAFNYNNRLIIHHETSTKATATRDRIKTDESEAFVGAGDLFDYPPKDLTLTDTGYAGLKHQFASILTQYGVFFLDYNTNKMFLLGENLQPISDQGLSLFFLKNTKLTFKTYYKDLVFSLTPTWTNTTYLATGKVVKYNNSLWKNNVVINPADGNPPSQSNPNWDFLYTYDNFSFEGEDSIYYGYIVGFDNYYRRLLVTKKDITATNTFVTNFKGEYDETLISSWSSNTALFIYNKQLYIKRATTGVDIISLPGGYFGEPIYFNDLTYFTPNRFTLGYYPEYKGWASWYNYYPDNYMANSEQFFSQRNTVLSEMNKYNLTLIPDNSGPVDTIIEPIFNNAEPVRLISVQWKSKALDNSYNEEVLTTFDTIQAYDSFQLSKENTIDNTVTARNLEGYWSCNDFRDDTLDNSVRVVDNSLWYRPLNNLNLNLTKHWSKVKKLVDYWFGVRFKYITYTEEAIMEHPSSYSNSTSDTGITYVTATLYTDPAIAVGDILKLVSANGNVYVKVISNVSTDVWKVKAYGPITFSGSNMAITEIYKLTKKAKLHLLDVTKLVIKNIR